MDLSVDTGVYIRLSAVMFLEYAVWGAWAPVLAARLLGPLKMSGKQTGWIYATLPIACIFAPFVSGQLADTTLDARYILVLSHLIGGVLMFTAVRVRSFGPLLATMFAYSVCYAGTLPLVNSVLFANVADPVTQGKVFIWAPIAWALVGYFLTAWRNLRKSEGEGSDCLVLAGVLSIVMAAASLAAPPTPPSGAKGMPIAEALAMLRNFDFLVFIVTSFVVAGMMQFYFLGSARFMIDIGIPSRNVPASMGIAQAAQTLATILVLWSVLPYLGLKQDNLLGLLGFKWTLTLGAACWLAMYVAYVLTQPKGLIIGSQVLHGLAYVMFMIVGQIYANAVAPESIRSTVQALIFAATTGVGLFLGTQLAGITMDKYSVNGQFQWRKIWMVPLVITLVGTLVLATIFQAETSPAPAQQAAVIASELPSS